jgi:hypothetical protein
MDVSPPATKRDFIGIAMVLFIIGGHPYLPSSYM